MFKRIKKVITGVIYGIKLTPLLMIGKHEEIKAYLIGKGYTHEEATEIISDIGMAQMELQCAFRRR